MSTENEEENCEALQKEIDEVNELIENYLKNIHRLTLQEKEDQKVLINEKIENIRTSNAKHEKALNQLETIGNGFATAILLATQVEDDEDTNTEVPIQKRTHRERAIGHTAPYVSYLRELIKDAKTDSEKAVLYNKIGYFYQRKAKEGMKEHFLRSLLSWSCARDNFENSLSKDPNHGHSVSGYAKSLINLGKYNSALTLLQKYTDEKERKNIKDYYRISAIAQRKLYNYSEAKKLLEKHPDKKFTEKELKLIENLEKIPSKSRIQIFKEHKNEVKVENYHKRQKSSTFRILSIDGGGMRGIIPACLICEIEKRTHLPASHSFNLISGTSTGGIISAGLTCPLNNDGFTPQYKAYDILDIYLNQGNRIFQKNFSLFGLNLFDSTYSAEGKNDLFKQYFGYKTISQSLTELVIPAADEESLFTTYLFNRRDARLDPFRDDTYIDALMATSAAPTFFPSHNIEGKGMFNDGGIHMNNPTNIACSEAIRYGADRNNIKVLSLGTGSYVPNALQKKTSRGLLFWAVNLHEVALEAQTGNADIIMSNMLGKERYQRWQIWFEKPITLDDFSEKNTTFLVESANQLIEEFDASDDNNINKIVEDILKE